LVFQDQYVSGGISDMIDNNKGTDMNDFSAMFEGSFKEEKSIETGSPVKGRVVAWDNDSIFLDIGTRMEAVLDRGPFQNSMGRLPKEGEEIQAMVIGRKHGMVQCAMELTRLDKQQDSDGPDLVAEAYRQGFPVEGRITGVNKGGFDVDIFGKRAFCPFSQMELQRIDNAEGYIDKTLSFQISEYAESGRNIIVSRRDLLKADADKQRIKAWDKLTEGTVVKGTVSSVKPYGAFIDLGGIQGLLHVSEMSFDKVNDPAELFKEGDEVEVEIMELDQTAERIRLGRKRFLTDPWDAAAEALAPGTEIIGKVSRIKPFGAFIEVMPGIDGLLHISRLGGERRIGHPKELLSIGQEVRVRVLEVDEEKRTISLTMEPVEEDVGAQLERLRQEQEKSQADRQTPMGALFQGLEDNKE